MRSILATVASLDPDKNHDVAAGLAEAVRLEEETPGTLASVFSWEAFGQPQLNSADGVAAVHKFLMDVNLIDEGRNYLNNGDRLEFFLDVTNKLELGVNPDNSTGQLTDVQTNPETGAPEGFNCLQIPD